MKHFDSKSLAIAKKRVPEMVKSEEWYTFTSNFLALLVRFFCLTSSQGFGLRPRKQCVPCMSFRGVTRGSLSKRGSPDSECQHVDGRSTGIPPPHGVG